MTKTLDQYLDSIENEYSKQISVFKDLRAYIIGLNGKFCECLVQPSPNKDGTLYFGWSFIGSQLTADVEIDSNGFVEWYYRDRSTLESDANETACTISQIPNRWFEILKVISNER
jgi:hypothetical protein